MRLLNPTTKNIIELKKVIYENELSGVSCAIAEDSEWGKCFVKILHYGQMGSIQEQKNALFRAKEEANCMKLVSQCTKQSPRLYDSWEDRTQKQYVLVMQQMEGITLREWMDKRPPKELKAKDLFVRSRMILQLCTIMREIQRKYPVIVHRDLKPENIFVHLNKDRHWKLSIIDFGCANINYVRKVGTVAYQAPEQIGFDGCSVQVSVKTDIFAIGQIFYELLLGSVPVVGTDYRLRAGEDRWTAVPSLTEEILALPGGQRLDLLLKRMTVFSAQDRLIYEKIIAELNRIQFR